MDFEKLQRDQERRQRAIQREIDRRQREQQARFERMERERQARMERIFRDQERRQRAIQRDIERRQREQQARFERMERERLKRYERLERERIKREEAYRRTASNFDFTEQKKYKEQSFISRIFSKLFRRHVREDRYEYDFSYENIFNQTFGSDDFSYSGNESTGEDDSMYGRQETDTRVSRAEQTRLELMDTLPRDSAQVLATCSVGNVRSFIATVYAAREANPERDDWSIYIAYRQSIEVQDPNPAMVEKTQIAGILLEGTRKEARFPF